MESTLIWGALALLSGIFICAYGNVLFRFVLAVLGFMAVLFTYFGVSFLLSGLHSYLT